MEAGWQDRLQMLDNASQIVDPTGKAEADMRQEEASPDHAPRRLSHTQCPTQAQAHMGHRGGTRQESPVGGVIQEGSAPMGEAHVDAAVEATQQEAPFLPPWAWALRLPCVAGRYRNCWGR